MTFVTRSRSPNAQTPYRPSSSILSNQRKSPQVQHGLDSHAFWHLSQTCLYPMKYRRKFSTRVQTWKLPQSLTTPAEDGSCTQLRKKEVISQIVSQKTLSSLPTIVNPAGRNPRRAMRVSDHPNLSLHFPHPNICLLSPLPNNEHRRKKKFNLRSSLPDQRMILWKTSKIPQIILGTTSLWNRCVFIRPSMDFPAIHLHWIGRKRQGVLPKQFRLAQPPRPFLVL